MDFGFNIDPKQKILSKVKEAVKEYQERAGGKTKFGEPIIGYAKADNPLFDYFGDKEITKYPKAIFRPGNTVIVHFTPYAPEVVESNRGGHVVSSEWQAAYQDSIMLACAINATIKETIDSIGHITSGTNTPGDWDQEKCSEVWSHKIAAYIAGMGDFNTTGSFVTESGFAGRFGCVITDFVIAPSKEWTDDEIREMDGVADRIASNCLYKGARLQSPVSDEKINSCPGNAISKEGVDRKVCQDFCKIWNDLIPAPDTCGKCYY